MPNRPNMPNYLNLDIFPLFQGLPASQLSSWENKFQCLSFRKRQPLIFPPNSSNVIYFVYTGKVKISYFSEDGKEFTVTILAAGDVYSEHSLAIATAIEDTMVLYLNMDDFQEMLEESPALARRLIRLLGQILRQANDLIFDLVFREAANRLARVFLRSVESDRVHFTHEELAAMIGTSRQTINDILRRWEQQGILTQHRGQVRILNLELLREKLDT